MANNYSSTAQATTLGGPITDSATSLTVAATTGFPVSTPYILAVDADASTEELVQVTNVAGTTLTVVRGYDSTSAVAHSSGAVVRHVHCAEDFRLSRQHEDASSAVHGLTGTVVGTTDTQALSNKTISLSNNTVSGSVAQFNTALTDDDFVTLTGTETLTNKTLDSPTITGVGQVTFRLKTADESISASTALQADNDIAFSVAASAKYILELGLVYDGAAESGGGSEGIKLALALPTGSTYTVVDSAEEDAPIDPVSASLTSWTKPTRGVGAYMNGHYLCQITTDATSGNAVLWWAQSGSSATATTLKAGSFARLTRVA